MTDAEKLRENVRAMLKERHDAAGRLLVFIGCLGAVLMIAIAVSAIARGCA